MKNTKELVDKIRELEQRRDLLATSISSLKNKLLNKEITIEQYQTAFYLSKYPQVKNNKLKFLNKEIFNLNSQLQNLKYRSPKTSQVTICILLVLLIGFVVFFHSFTLTGFFAFEEETGFGLLEVNQEFMQDLTLKLNLNNIKSLKISGKFINYSNKSTIKVYALVDDKEIIILDNSLITSLETKSSPTNAMNTKVGDIITKQKQQNFDISFENLCKESCLLNKINIDKLVIKTNNVVLQINNLAYFSGEAYFDFNLLTLNKIFPESNSQLNLHRSTSNE